MYVHIFESEHIGMEPLSYTRTHGNKTVRARVWNSIHETKSIKQIRFQIDNNLFF